MGTQILKDKLGYPDQNTVLGYQTWVPFNLRNNKCGLNFETVSGFTKVIGSLEHDLTQNPFS